MAWMMDTYSTQQGHAVPEIVTGKPISIGGSVFRHEATGAGVVMVIERACARLGWDLAGAALRRAGLRQRRRRSPRPSCTTEGATVIAVSDVSAGCSSPTTGSTSPSLHEYVAAHGSLEGYQPVAGSRTPSCSSCDCDILVLAAREDQVTAENAGNLQCRLVVEGANGPTSIAADAVLADRGIPVLPDVLTNAGGVTVSYFEWVQDLGRLFWDRDEIRAAAGRQARRRVRPGLGSGRERGISLREAALVAGHPRASPPRSRLAGSIHESASRAARPRCDGLRPAGAQASPRRASGGRRGADASRGASRARLRRGPSSSA